MRIIAWMWIVLVACNGDDGARHIVDGQGSGSAAGPVGFVEVIVEDEGSIYGAAGFSTAAGATTLPPTCTATTVGACTLTTCTTTPTTPPVTYDDAGAITFAGTAATVTLVEAADHSYRYGPDDTTPPYADGDMVTLTGAGATVPAFSKSVMMPVPVQIDAPTPGTIVPRSSDLTVSWSNGNRNNVIELELFQQSPYAGVVCTLMDQPDTGSFAIPSSLLQPLSITTTIALGFSYAATQGMVGDYAMQFYAGSVAHSAGGGDYQASVILQ